jgi:hypothetical protein
MSEQYAPHAPNASSHGSNFNEVVARRLEEVAALLELQGAGVHRVRAWRAGASRIRGLSRPVAEILREEGTEGLESLPDVGPVIARAVKSLVVASRFPMLERLRGETDPERLLASIPGIGRKLARRLHERADIRTLEDLEAAAESGRLSTIEGFGDKRLTAILDSLARRLGRVRSQPPSTTPAPISELLAIDAEYRRKAQAGELRRIAPRRFNPEHEAWLPVLHTSRGGRDYTALFSTTARAHELGRTRDWVVIYHDGPEGERAETVVTVRNGALAGSRVVRGREHECLRHYVEARKSGTPLPPETVHAGAGDPAWWKEKLGPYFGIREMPRALHA